jgi:gamma-butyrobetaine dioxygenase
VSALVYHYDPQFTDIYTSYYESPPRYQVLHSLVNKVAGGTSIFVDAFERAQALHKSEPSSFNTLVNNLVRFYYNNDGHFLNQSHPTISLDHSGSQIQYINYSPPFQAPFPFNTPSEVWKGLKSFSSLLDEPAARFEYTMQEGDAVIFDNRRVLHARTEFNSKEGDDGRIETNRWLKGCYLDADALYDQARMIVM